MTPADNDGGTAWELRRAAGNLAAAVGNDDAREAALDLAAALANQSLSVVIPTLQAVLEGAMQRGFADFGEKLDALAQQNGRLEAGISSLQAGFRSLGKAMTRLSTRVAVVERELHTRYEESKADRADLRARLTQIRAELLQPEQRDRLLAEHAQVIAELAALKERIDSIERERRAPADDR